jgi:hypothetical protein
MVVGDNRGRRTFSEPRMSPNESRYLRSPRLAGVVSFIVVGVFFGVAVAAFLGVTTVGQPNRGARLREVVATARVLEARTEPASHDRTSTYFVITFSTRDGKTIVADLRQYLPDVPPVVGGTVVVRYDPDQPAYMPHDVRVSRSASSTVLFLWAVCVGFGLAGIGVGHYVISLRSSALHNAGLAKAARRQPRV